MIFRLRRQMLELTYLLTRGWLRRKSKLSPQLHTAVSALPRTAVTNLDLSARIYTLPTRTENGDGRRLGDQLPA